ncbi:hypothetical protein FXO38_29694 [Capsicum annuum]|nr:hypothetical protein FXO38_29694 [Capsicum annuum]
MVWWEAVLSPALQVLFDKLASGDVLNIVKVWNVNELLLDKLKISYFINTAVLDDAEEKQYLNPAVETWIDMLRDAVFEAEDTLDELATEALRCKLEPDSQKYSQQSLLESATAKPFDTNSLEIIQNGFKNLFSKQRFLVVLYDVWTESCDDWNKLLIPFFEGDQRSKIIVTTRNEGVASISGTLAPHRLQEMSHDACWSLFLHHAFGVRGLDMHARLKEIGEEIVKRCKGLPLDIKTLGGMFNLWDLPSKKYSVLPSLRLSYHHLPPNLKRCFAYCSTFPKGYEFNKKDLVLLWMAEGFVQPAAQITMEEVGNANFTELQSTCFFQESSQNRSLFVMHDVVHDLALKCFQENMYSAGGKLEKQILPELREGSLFLMHS